MNQREQVRAIGRALAAGDTATAATLAADLAPMCDGEGILSQWTPVREILDAIAALGQRDPSNRGTIDLQAMRDGDADTSDLADVLADHGIRAGHAHRPAGSKLVHVTVRFDDAPDADPGVTGFGGTLAVATANAVRALLVARYSEGRAS